MVKPKQDEASEYKKRMDVAKERGHMMAYRDLKKHYDKLVRQR